LIARKQKTTRKKSKTYPYDSAEYLNSGESVHAYMEEALKTGDPAFIANALGTVARARGMSQTAKKAGLSRESLYKALGAEGNPEFGTVLRVMRALGLIRGLELADGSRIRALNKKWREFARHALGGFFDFAMMS
jgi:probable addiction module antidote protein